MWEKYGRRNIQNLAIAPTGSLSILAKTSSGIEPVFSLRYTRRRRVLKEEEGVEYAIDDNNEKWEEFVIVHHKLQEWYNITHKEKLDLTTVSKEKFDEIVKDSPYYGSTAHEIEPSSKITLQGAAQKWIDSSISNTLNLPEDVTEEKVLEYALFAWETGTKGFTIYREGSRGGILITDKLNKNNFSQIDAAKRPEMLQCEFHNFMIDNVSWIVLVGLLNDKPYEIFAFKDDFLVPIDSELVLQKVKSRHYRLLSNGKTLIEDINDKFETPEEEFITRLISTSLRHGTHVKFITEQLTKSAGYISDFRSAIARVLIKYVEDDEMASKENCPECSQVLSYENGCVSCKACGYTKC